MATPETRFAEAGDLSIAYQVVGSGDVDVILVPQWLSNIEQYWEHPSAAYFLRRIAAFSRLIMFDKRGTGLSDPLPTTQTLEERMDDVLAVMDAVGSERAVLLGTSEGGPMAALFAATRTAASASSSTARAPAGCSRTTTRRVGPVRWPRHTGRSGSTAGAPARH
jgi:pimeloyl-ACP methyl ester carboxylesterase